MLSLPPSRADTLFDDLIVVMQSSPAQFVRDHGWAAIEVTEGQKKKPPSQTPRRRAGGDTHMQSERSATTFVAVLTMARSTLGFFVSFF